MAISTPTTVIAAGNTANLGTYDTAAVTLVAGRLYAIQLTGYRSGGGTVVNSVTHDPAGTPLSFAIISDGTNDARVQPWDAASHRTLTHWYVIPGATTSNALIRIIWASTQSACGWRLVEIASGFDSTGGATTFPAVRTNSGTVAAVTVTMPTFGATDNLLLLGVGWGSGTSNPSETIAPTESRTELGEHNDGERASLAVHYQNPNGGDTSIGATLSAANDWGAVGIEVAAAAAGPDIPPRPTIVSDAVHHAASW